MTDPVTFGAAALRVFGWASALGGGRPAITRQERRELAARGYTPSGRGAFRTPTGERVSARDARRTLYAQASAPQPQPDTIDNSPTQPRTPGGPGYRPPSWQVSPLPGPWQPPATDSEVYDFERSSGILNQGFVGPVPTIPDTLPRTVPRTVTRTVVSVLSRALALPWFIFYPSRTADDDEIEGPMPQPAPSRGPPRRPVVRPGTRPAWPEPDFYPQPRPRAPTRRPRWRPRPTEEPNPVLDPQPSPSRWPRTRPQPAPGTTPAPGRRPQPAPSTRPAPTAPRIPWPQLLPYLPLLAPTPTARPRTVPRPPDLQPDRPTAPLTEFQPQPVRLPAAADPCAAQADRKRRRKSECRNPVTSSRTFKRGGRKFRTITRRLEC